MFQFHLEKSNLRFEKEYHNVTFDPDGKKELLKEKNFSFK